MTNRHDNRSSLRPETPAIRHNLLASQLREMRATTLRLSDRAAAEAGEDVDHAADSTVRVIVFFKDEAGQRVAHYFKRVS
jgi:hypothetical protein